MSLLMACQKDIPVPACRRKIDSINIASSSANPIGYPAKRYHDKFTKDGSPIDTLIFAHPKNKMDVFIATVGFRSTKFSLHYQWNKYHQLPE